MQGFLEDLGFHDLLAQHALEITHPFLEFAHLGGTHNIFISLNGQMATFEHAALPGKELGWGMPACRALQEMLMPGCMASSTSRTFSATDQRRRHCTEVMTSTRRNGSSEFLDIVVLIGACLISYANCPVEIRYAPNPPIRQALARKTAKAAESNRIASPGTGLIRSCLYQRRS